MGNTHIITICVEPEFDEVVARADKIAKENGMSRSVVFRTALHEYFDVSTAYPKTQQRFASIIKQALNEIKQAAIEMNC